MARLRRVGKATKAGDAYDVVCDGAVIGDADIEKSDEGWWVGVIVHGEQVLADRTRTRTEARALVGRAARKARCRR